MAIYTILYVFDEFRRTHVLHGLRQVSEFNVTRLEILLQILMVSVYWFLVFLVFFLNVVLVHWQSVSRPVF